MTRCLWCTSRCLSNTRLPSWRSSWTDWRHSTTRQRGSASSSTTTYDTNWTKIYCDLLCSGLFCSDLLKSTCDPGCVPRAPHPEVLGALQSSVPRSPAGRTRGEPAGEQGQKHGCVSGERNYPTPFKLWGHYITFRTIFVLFTDITDVWVYFRTCAGVTGNFELLLS